MSDPIILYPSALVGLLLILCYLIKHRKDWDQVKIPALLGLLLKGSGLVTGCLLMASVFLPELRVKLSNIEIYVLISGLAVVYVSIQGIRNDVFRRTKPPEVHGDGELD